MRTERLLGLTLRTAFCFPSDTLVVLWFSIQDDATPTETAHDEDAARLSSDEPTLVVVVVVVAGG